MEDPTPEPVPSNQGAIPTSACSRVSSAAVREPDVTSRPMTCQTGSGVTQSQHTPDVMSRASTCYGGARPSRSRASSRSCDSLWLKPFGFETQTSFEAARGLLKSRSDSFLLRPSTKDNDIWKRPPPDFRPQVFAPKPPKRNSRESMQPWKYGTFPGQYKMIRRERTAVLPHILQPQKEDEGRLVTRFDIPDPYEAKLTMCKEGLHPTDPYVTPKPHDFRGYPPIKSLGLPEFETGYEHDPYNIHFNSKRLNIIQGLVSSVPTERDIHGRQMAPPLPAQPMYEERLILERESWPIKSGSYTRHRRKNRTAHSALMERVEDTLSAQWAKERLLLQLEKCTQ